MGTERDAGYADFVRGKRLQQAPGGYVPNADVWPIVVARTWHPQRGGCQNFSTRAERRGESGSPKRARFGARGQPFSVGGKSNDASAGGNRKGLRFLACGDFKELDLRTIPAGGQDARAVGSEGHARCLEPSHGDCAHAPAGGDIPKIDLRALPIFKRCSPAAIGRERIEENGQRLEFPAGSQLPSAGGHVFAIFARAAGTEQAAVGSDGERLGLVPIESDGVNFGAGGGVVDFDIGIPAFVIGTRARGQELPVGVESDLLGPLAGQGKGIDRIAGGGIPDANRTIAACRSEARAVRTERERRDAVCVTVEHALLAGRGDIPYAYGLVVSGGGSQAAVGAEGDRRNGGGVAVGEEPVGRLAAGGLLRLLRLRRRRNDHGARLRGGAFLLRGRNLRRRRLLLRGLRRCADWGRRLRLLTGTGERGGRDAQQRHQRGFAQQRICSDQGLAPGGKFAGRSGMIRRMFARILRSFSSDARRSILILGLQQLNCRGCFLPCSECCTLCIRFPTLCAQHKGWGTRKGKSRCRLKGGAANIL